ncbi:MAG: rRNA maturation RNase YbeY [bacterium]
MIKVKINNKISEKKVDEELFDLFEKIVREGVRLEGYNKGEVSIALVNDENIKKLNQKYRNLNQPTDVLSFPLDDELLGDIIISVETAYRQAEEYGHSFQREMSYLLTHGLLHILGYDHKNPGDKKQMRQKEERILSKFNLERDREE